MAQLWGGRFTKETDQLVYNFNASISFDQKFFREDIEGSIAHVVMLEKQGILKAEEKDAIVSDGILFCSGMIAGEGLVGILLALLAVFGLDSVIDLSARFNLPPAFSNIGGLVLFAVIVLTVLKFSVWKKRS